MTPCCANSHMSVPLRVLTLRTSLYTRIYSQAYIDHITGTFIYEPMFCELTYASSLASAHTLKPCFYAYILWQENTYHVIDTFCIWIHVLRTHICLCPCKCSHLEPPYIHASTHKYIYIYISYYRYFCVWLRVVRTNIYLKCTDAAPCFHPGLGGSQNGFTSGELSLGSRWDVLVSTQTPLGTVTLKHSLTVCHPSSQLCCESGVTQRPVALNQNLL